MDLESPEPSPKRRRTGSADSSPSSRRSSPDQTGSAQPPRTRHALPTRRATLELRGGESALTRRYSPSRSRSHSLDGRKLSDDEDAHTYEPRRTSSRRRRRSESISSAASHGFSHSHPSTRSPSPLPIKPKRLAFSPLFTIPKAHARGITSLKFSPDGSLLATSSADATINIYTVTRDSTPFPLLKTLRGHLAGINAIAWSPSPPFTLASGSDDKSIMLWDPPSAGDTPIAPSPLIGHHNYVYSLAFSPKGNMLVSGSFDEAVFLWDVRRASVMRRLPAHSDPVGGVDFLRDGTMMCSCAGDGLIRIWDAGTGQCLRTLVDEDRPAVTGVRFTPNGQYVLAWTLDDSIRLWRYTEGRCVKTYQGHRNKQYSLSGCVGEYMGGQEAFVATGSEDGDVVVWDVTSKEVLWRGEGHGQPVLAVDFCRTRDGRGLLVSGGLDRDVRVWVEVDEEGEETRGGNEEGVDVDADVLVDEEGGLTNGVSYLDGIDEEES